MKVANHRPKRNLRNKAEIDLDAYLVKKLRDSEFRVAYEAENQRMDLILQIVRLRKARGMTQADLARAIGTHQANISRLERMDYNFTLDMLERIAESLGAEIKIELAPRKAA